MMYILSWVMPLIYSTLTLYAADSFKLIDWYFILPLMVLITCVIRDTLISIFGIHTTITYKVEVLNKEKSDEP